LDTVKRSKIAPFLLILVGFFFSSGAFAYTAHQAYLTCNASALGSQYCTMYRGTTVVYQGKAIGKYGGSNLAAIYPFDEPWTGVCPVNTHDDVTYQCVPNASIVCPTHQHNVDPYTCAADPAIVCPLNQHNVDDYTCAADPAIVCPTNQHNITDYLCVADPSIICPTNQHNITDYLCADDDPIICPLGQHNEDAYTCAPDVRTPIDCESGFHDDGIDSCVYDVYEPLPPLSSYRIPAVHLVQHRENNALISTFSPTDGVILPSVAADTPITPYVGYWDDPITHQAYYSYRVTLDIGKEKQKNISVLVRFKISNEDLADLMIYSQTDALNTAKNDYFQWLDFFISPLEANPLVGFAFKTAAGSLLTAMLFELGRGLLSGAAQSAGADIYQAAKDSLSGGSGSYTCPVDGINYASPSSACAGLQIINPITMSFYSLTARDVASGGGYHFTCVDEKGFSRGSVYGCSVDGSSGGASAPNYYPHKFSPKQAARAAAAALNEFKSAVAAAIGGSLGDLAKKAYDAFKNSTGGGGGGGGGSDSPTPSKPGGDKPGAGAGKCKLGENGKCIDVKNDPEFPDADQDTQTSPDGTQTQTKTTVKTEQIGDDTLSTVIETIIKIISAAGEVISETKTTEAPPSNPNQPSADVCKDHPDIIGCSYWGDIPEPEEIKTHDVQATFEPDAAPVGSCPADKVIATSYGNINLPFTPFCTFAGYINPLLVAFGYLTAGFILFGAIKE
jgi:hypothetical protein